MHCGNCGANNRDGAAYCAKCGQRLSANIYDSSGLSTKKSSNNQIIKIVAVIAAVCLVFGGGFLLLKDTVFGSDVAIDGITVDGDYKMKGGTYIFGVNKTVVLEPRINSSSDKVNLRYELEDNSVASISKLDNKCSIFGITEKQTNLNIYEGDKILKVVKISFEDDSKAGDNIDKNTNNNNTSNTSNNETTNSNNTSSSSIPLDDLTYFMSQYFDSYVDATNYGDFSMVSGKLTSGGQLYNQYQKSIPKTYDKGISIDLRSMNKNSAKKISNGVYSLTYTVDYVIYNSQEGTTRVQREYADYIVKQSGSGFKVDRVENWQILSKQYI